MPYLRQIWPSAWAALFCFFGFGLARWRPGSGQNGATTAAAALVRRALSRLSLDPDRDVFAHAWILYIRLISRTLKP